MPQELLRLVGEKPYIMDDVGMSCASVLLFEDAVLKIQPITEETDSEVRIMKWLEGKLPVPKCLFYKEIDGICYLLMSRISGKMSCYESCMQDPWALTKLLADSIKRLWQVDISNCPVRWDLERKLVQAKQAVANGEVDIADAEPDTFGENGFADAMELYQWLENNRPEEDLVLSHGDFCLPNIFIENGVLSGYIDLGRTGIADRWQDIALCYRSLKHNFDGTYGGKVYRSYDPNLLFDALEITPDWEKLKYYILLDELF